MRFRIQELNPYWEVNGRLVFCYAISMAFSGKCLFVCTHNLCWVNWVLGSLQCCLRIAMYHTLLLVMPDYITWCQVIYVHYVYLPGIKHQQMTATPEIVHQRSVSLEYMQPLWIFGLLTCQLTDSQQILCYQVLLNIWLAMFHAAVAMMKGKGKFINPHTSQDFLLFAFGITPNSFGVVQSVLGWL